MSTFGPKSRRPKHIREYLSDSEYYVYSSQNPEGALSEMRSLMYYFMEKYEEEQKKVSERIKSKKDLDTRLIRYGYFKRGCK